MDISKSMLPLTAQVDLEEENGGTRTVMQR
jgi:hypothetical protein